MKFVLRQYIQILLAFQIVGDIFKHIQHILGNKTEYCMALVVYVNWSWSMSGIMSLSITTGKQILTKKNMNELDDFQNFLWMQATP